MAPLGAARSRVSATLFQLSAASNRVSATLFQLSAARSRVSAALFQLSAASNRVSAAQCNFEFLMDIGSSYLGNSRILINDRLSLHAYSMHTRADIRQFNERCIAIL